MEYNNEQYLKDLEDPNFSHLESKEHFQNFYNELGKQPSQMNQKFVAGRSGFIFPREKILELGCHWGFNLILWAKQGFQCTGIEVSKTLVEYGNKQIEKENEDVQSRIKLINGFIEDFIPEQKYDTIILTETLEHVIDPLVILRKAASCLDYNGLIYISVPSAKWGNSSHVRGLNKFQLNELIKKSCLEVHSWIENRWYEIEGGNVCPITIAIAGLEGVLKKNKVF